MDSIWCLEAGSGTESCCPLQNSQYDRYKHNVRRLLKQVAKATFQLPTVGLERLDQTFKEREFTGHDAVGLGSSYIPQWRQ
jgi:hypothetical protein